MTTPEQKAEPYDDVAVMAWSNSKFHDDSEPMSVYISAFKTGYQSASEVNEKVMALLKIDSEINKKSNIKFRDRNLALTTQNEMLKKKLVECKDALRDSYNKLKCCFVGCSHQTGNLNSSTCSTHQKIMECIASTKERENE